MNYDTISNCSYINTSYLSYFGIEASEDLTMKNEILKKHKRYSLRQR